MDGVCEDDLCWLQLDDFRMLLIKTIDPSRITPYLRQCQVTLYFILLHLLLLLRLLHLILLHFLVQLLPTSTSVCSSCCLSGPHRSPPLPSQISSYLWQCQVLLLHLFLLLILQPPAHQNTPYLCHHQGLLLHFLHFLVLLLLLLLLLIHFLLLIYLFLPGSSRY